VAGLQPLVIVDGQIEALGDRKLEIQKLNLGTEELILVGPAPGNSVTITGSHHFLENATGGVRNVDNILGGEEGDMLILKGNDIRLRGAGNLEMSSNYRLEPGRTIVFLFAGGVWLEIARKNT